MNHADHVALIEAGIPRHGGGVWVELGAGSGAFSLALRDLAGPNVAIYALDRDRGVIRLRRQAFDRQFPGSDLHDITGDFAAPPDLPPLDGILAANALHFTRDPAAILRRWRPLLKPAGRLIVVEYDADRGNQWVPYPFPFATFQRLAHDAGFGEPVLLGRRSSRFMDGMYAAMSLIDSPVASTSASGRSKNARTD